MQVESVTTLWLDASQVVSIDDLANLSGLKTVDIRELVEAGALNPINTTEKTWAFSAECVVTARKAARLRDDLELDIDALALVLDFLERICTLEEELVRLRAQLPSVKSR
jgi:chaperone modulatory protein CbpM